jgi:hypothetical protein
MTAHGEFSAMKSLGNRLCARKVAMLVIYSQGSPSRLTPAPRQLHRRYAVAAAKFARPQGIAIGQLYKGFVKCLPIMIPSIFPHERPI